MSDEHPTPEQRQIWADWVASRPESVRRLAEQFQPWQRYRIKATGQICRLYSFGEGDHGETDISVSILIADNPGRLVLTDYVVFGCQPADLEPCGKHGERVTP